MIPKGKVGVYMLNPKYTLTATVNHILSEPKFVKSTLKHPGWHAAMLEEIDALNINQTWELVPSSRPMNIIGCKWVIKTKLQADRSVERLKARLAAKGYNQQGVWVFLKHLVLSSNQVAFTLY